MKKRILIGLLLVMTSCIWITKDDNTHAADINQVYDYIRYNGKYSSSDSYYIETSYMKGSHTIMLTCSTKGHGQLKFNYDEFYDVNDTYANFDSVSMEIGSSGQAYIRYSTRLYYCFADGYIDPASYVSGDSIDFTPTSYGDSYDYSTIDTYVDLTGPPEVADAMEYWNTFLKEKTGYNMADVGLVRAFPDQPPAGDDPSVPVSPKALTAKALNYSNTSKYSYSTVTVTGSSNYTVCPIKAKGTGKLYVDVKVPSSIDSGADIAVGKFSGSSLTSGSSEFVDAGTTAYGIGGYDVTSGKTYSVGIQSYDNVSVKVTAYVIPYSTRTLAAGKTMIASGYKKSYSDSKALFKIRPKKSGKITVKLSPYGMFSSSGQVTLLNSKKKVISDKVYSSAVFGVKKGTTYYLRVTGTYGSEDKQYKYGIKYTQKAAVLKNNTTKSKAVTLKRKGKALSITRPATGKTMTQWYKAKVTGARQSQVVINAKGIETGSAKVTVYYNSRKLGTSQMLTYMNNVYTINHDPGSWGTLYFKVSTSKKFSGVYKISYKK